MLVVLLAIYKSLQTFSSLKFLGAPLEITWIDSQVSRFGTTLLFVEETCFMLAVETNKQTPLSGSLIFNQAQILVTFSLLTFKIFHVKWPPIIKLPDCLLCFSLYFPQII